MFEQCKTYSTDTKLQEHNIFENVYHSVIINGEGRIFERITEGNTFN